MATKSIKAGNAFVEIGIRNRVAAGAKAVQADLNKLSGALRKHGQSIMRLGGAVATSMAAPLALAIRAASEMEETMGKFSVVFGDAAKSMRAFAEATASQMGVTEQSMLSMLSSMQDLLVPMGVMDDKAQDMSKELSKLAIDLASFNNMSPKKTFEDLMAAMTGSGEVMKKYGVILSQSAVNQELLNTSIDPKTATEAQKAFARMTIIMRGTTAAQGDAIRTSGSFANRMKAFGAILLDVTAALGKPLLEPLAHLLGYLNSGVSYVKSFVKENQEMVRVLGVGMVAVGGIGVALVGAGAALQVAGMGFGVVAGAIGLLMNPIVLAIAGIGTLGVAFVQMTDLGEQMIEALQERFGPLVETVKKSVTAIGKALQAGDIKSAWGILVSTLELMWLDMSDGLRTAWVGFVDFFLDTQHDILTGMATMVSGLADLLETIVGAFENFYSDLYNGFLMRINDDNGVRVIGDPVRLKSSDAGLKNFTKRIGLHEGIDTVRTFGNTAADHLSLKQDARAQARLNDTVARNQRKDELRAMIDMASKRVVEEPEKPNNDNEKNNDENKSQNNDDLTKSNDELAKVLKDFLKDTNEQFQVDADETTGGEVQQTENGRIGPSGTFSAFGASIMGMVPQMQKVTDPDLLKEQKIANRELAQMNRHLKNMGGGVIGLFND